MITSTIAFPSPLAATRHRVNRMIWLGWCLAALAPLGVAQSTGAPDVPLALIENQGQWRASTLFAAATNLGSVRIEHDGVSLRRDTEYGSDDVLQLRFRGAEVMAVIPGRRLPAVYHFLLGADRSGWRTYVPAVSEVTYVLSSGAVVSVTGSSQGLGLSVGDTGDSESPLVLECVSTGDWDGTQTAFQLGEGESSGLLFLRGAASSMDSSGTVWFAERMDDRTVRLESPVTDSTASLVLEWATLLGGTGGEFLNDMMVDAAGRIIVVGRATNPDFPTTAEGVYPDPLTGQTNGYVSILDGQGTVLLSSTYFVSRPEAVDVAEDGSILLAGWTTSTELPVSPSAFSPTKSGIADMFVARLSPEADDVLAASYIGGTASNPVEELRDVVAAPNGDMILVGAVPDGFPTTPGSYQPDFGGGTDDAFITRFTADATSLVFSTYLGGDGVESAGQALVDESGRITLVGGTNSVDFPTTPGALSTGVGGSYIVRLSADGSALDFASVFGPGAARVSHEAADGTLFIVGRTSSMDFPVTPGAFDTTLEENQFQINYDLYLARLSPGATAIEWATYLGTVLPESPAIGLVVDSAGTPTVTGGTPSSLFPTTPGAHHQDGGSFATRFHRSGSRLLYSTMGFCQGSSSWPISPAHLDPTGRLIVAGTGSEGCPTTPGAFDESLDGLSDGYIAKLTMLPAGVTRYGDSTPGPEGAIAAGVLAMPWVGNAGFGLTATNGPPLAHGWLLLGTAALPTPAPAVGAALWVDPMRPIGLAPVQTDELGYVEERVPIPDAPVLLGMEAYAQFVFPGKGGTASASNALRLIVQAAPE